MENGRHPTRLSRGENDMTNETPQFIHGIAGVRSAHQWPGPRPPDTELTWAAHLIVVCTLAPEPDQPRSGQEKGLLRRLRSLRVARRVGQPQQR